MANQEAIGDVERWSMVVVYDESTGTVVHTHQVVTSRGGAHPDDAAIEREALELAGHRGSDTGQRLSPLRVDPRSINADSHYQVDSVKRTLVEVPRAPRR
ncbi:MAG TPA: hypothetical protein VKK31_31490 [Thermoanaerobaculia bacterium]|nr:hypothetical protein [Thermoanaerobaculia bacterium]